MGFGKYVLGGICAVGAVIAAPVALPAMGAAIAGSTLTGTVGLAVGTAVAGASSTTAAVVAGAAGVAAGAAQEKKLENAYDKGRKDGYKRASNEYERKFREQEERFNIEITKYKQMQTINASKRDELENILGEMLEYIRELENEIERLKGSGESIKECQDHYERVRLKYMEGSKLLVS